MSDYKEFTGKSLDDAIQAACSHFSLDRDKLELEIVSGGSSGIFGLVGKKRAVVRARPLHAATLMAEAKPAPEAKKPKAKPNPKKRAADSDGAGAEQDSSGADTPEPGAAEGEAGENGVKPKRKRSRSRKPKAKAKPENGDAAGDEQAEPQAANGRGGNGGEAGDEPAAAPKKKRNRRRKPKKNTSPSIADEPGTVQASAGPEDFPDLDDQPDSEVSAKDAADNGRNNSGSRPDREESAGAAEEEVPLDNPELEEYLRKAVTLMAEPIVGNVVISMARTSDRIRVHVTQDGAPQSESAAESAAEEPEVVAAEPDGTEDQGPDNVDDADNGLGNGVSADGDDEPRDFAGLLIGRDGQNLSAMQYLLNRMVGKQWPEAPKVQLDAGDYRERLNEKLRKMAHFLADKAQNTGKVQSTKPLSSYHRRVVHLALQDQNAITTRSKGDGPMKRVLILPKRKK